MYSHQIVDGGALPLFVKMMEHNIEEEQYAASRTTWTLAFDKNVREKIISEPGCMESLDKLALNGCDKVRKTAKGALWVINDSATHNKEERGED